MKLAILNGLGEEPLRRCLNSLRATTAGHALDVTVLTETGIREQTLNAALRTVGTDDDLLLVGDDITFTPGWLEKLRATEAQGDIWGMGMLYPESDRIQDRGYDLVAIDSRVVLEPLERGRPMDQAESFGWRYCDGVCGCFMYVRRGVFQSVPAFREDAGCNRWGEFVFIADARRAGARIGVVDHFLEHAGVGTKGHADLRFASTSYLTEKAIWQRIADEFVDPSWVRQRRLSVLDEQFIEDLRRPDQRILIYGVGSVTEAVLDLVPDAGARATFVSGLQEEVGARMAGGVIRNVGDISPGDFDWILITPLHIGQDLFDRHFRSRLPAGFRGRVSVATATAEGGAYRYEFIDIVPRR